MQVWVVERSIDLEGTEHVGVYATEWLAAARVAYEERAAISDESYAYFPATDWPDPSEILTEFKGTL